MKVENHRNSEVLNIGCLPTKAANFVEIWSQKNAWFVFWSLRETCKDVEQGHWGETHDKETSCLKYSNLVSLME